MILRKSKVFRERSAFSRVLLGPRFSASCRHLGVVSAWTELVVERGRIVIDVVIAMQ